jgi:molecular chaperone HscB
MSTPDYFDFYQLPQGFRFDPATLRKKYYSLSREYHPDRFAQSGSEEYAEALRMSALNNEAFHTLGDVMRSLGYVLRLHGLLQEEEAYNLPPEFLMEMMDLNEAVDEGGESAHSTYADALHQWEEGANPLMSRFESGERAPELMLGLKDYYFRKKYLNRIGSRLAAH